MNLESYEYLPRNFMTLSIEEFNQALAGEVTVTDGMYCLGSRGFMGGECTDSYQNGFVDAGDKFVTRDRKHINLEAALLIYASKIQHKGLFDNPYLSMRRLGSSLFAAEQISGACQLSAWMGDSNYARELNPYIKRNGRYYYNNDPAVDPRVYPWIQCLPNEGLTGRYFTTLPKHINADAWREKAYINAESQLEITKPVYSQLVKLIDDSTDMATLVLALEALRSNITYAGDTNQILSPKTDQALPLIKVLFNKAQALSSQTNTVDYNTIKLHEADLILDGLNGKNRKEDEYKILISHKHTPSWLEALDVINKLKDDKTQVAKHMKDIFLNLQEIHTNFRKNSSKPESLEQWQRLSKAIVAYDKLVNLLKDPKISSTLRHIVERILKKTRQAFSSAAVRVTDTNHESGPSKEFNLTPKFKKWNDTMKNWGYYRCGSGTGFNMTDRSTRAGC